MEEENCNVWMEQSQGELIRADPIDSNNNGIVRYAEGPFDEAMHVDGHCEVKRDLLEEGRLLASDQDASCLWLNWKPEKEHIASYMVRPKPELKVNLLGDGFLKVFPVLYYKTLPIENGFTAARNNATTVRYCEFSLKLGQNTMVFDLHLGKMMGIKTQVQNKYGKDHPKPYNFSIRFNVEGGDFVDSKTFSLISHHCQKPSHQAQKRRSSGTTEKREPRAKIVQEYTDMVEPVLEVLASGFVPRKAGPSSSAINPIPTLEANASLPNFNAAGGSQSFSLAQMFICLVDNATRAKNITHTDIASAQESLKSFVGKEEGLTSGDWEMILNFFGPTSKCIRNLLDIYRKP